MQTITGHYKRVTSVCWSSNSDYLVTGSEDQTTRIWGLTNDNTDWIEVSRAQIHGYDINSLALISLPDVDQDPNVSLSNKGISYF